MTELEQGLIKSTPMEETFARISNMRTRNMETNNNAQMRDMTNDALVYVFWYLRDK
jgi:hypothetical protein